jgi:predicted transcriptional regulator
MKTTLEISDSLFRRAKTLAASRRILFRALVSQALADELRSQRDNNKKPWMTSFGKLRHLHNETTRINRIIQQEFDQID